MQIRAILHSLLIVLAVTCAAEARAFQTPTSAAPAATGKTSCPIDNTPPSDADKALQERHYADAERLYTEALAANPNSDVAQAGLVRTILAQDKFAEALALALKDNAAHPNDPLLLDALGEVRFRRGEVDEAANAFNHSVQLNLCNGVTLYDTARYLNFSGMYHGAQVRLDMAHALSPLNPEITRRWRASHAIPPTPEQRLATMKAMLNSPSLPDQVKEGIQASIKAIEVHERGGCELVSPITEVKLPIESITNGSGMAPMNISAAGLEVQFNGKKRRLEIDTGASGILLSRSVAKSAGLVPEMELKAGGIGDGGQTGLFVTHVDDIKIGSMEFKNCIISVLEKNMLNDVDGLIGPDVFRDFLVTLDIPSREVRIGPLPKRPDDTTSQPASLRTSESDDAAPLVSNADRARDRYISPEMKDWTPIFRSNHFLIIPTHIGEAPWKLFMMDTGAQFSMITPEAAREVTQVSSDSGVQVRGINGEVQKVMVADRVTIAFANVRQVTNGMRSFDSKAIAQLSGVEISGLIGFPTLRELVLSIDYRDNLVHIVYDPKKGYHAH